jgi:hypothetical protein
MVEHQLLYFLQVLTQELLVQVVAVVTIPAEDVTKHLTLLVEKVAVIIRLLKQEHLVAVAVVKET